MAVHLLFTNVANEHPAHITNPEDRKKNTHTKKHVH
jgi:hypothetical protein